MRQVSKKYIELMKEEKNNYEHTYKIKNITRNFELTELLENDSLIIKRFLRKANGKISPSNINLKLIARADAPAKMLIKEFYRKYKEFTNKKWHELIFEEGIEEYLVKIGDIIEVYDSFNGEELVLFNGVVTGVTKTDTDLKRTVSVTVDDNTIKGYEYTFTDDLVLENYFIYNEAEKEKSLLYILATKFLELPPEKLAISNINYKIPLATFKKGERIMEAFSSLVKSFYGNIYMLPDGTLKINSLFDKSYIQKLDLTFGNKKNNYPILDFIETTEYSPKENKVEIKYNNLEVGEKQTIFSLGGKNATKNDAKIIIKKNTKGEEWWRIDFNDVIELDKTPIVKAYYLQNEEEKAENYQEYILEWINERTARLKFNNSKNHDIFIKEFKFLGRPVIKTNENSIFYTEHTKLKDNEVNLKTYSFKHVVNKEQATELAKHTFYNECREYKTIKLRVNNMPFLELEDVINLDFKKYNGQFQIIAINQHHNLTELILKQYEDYQAYNKFIISEKNIKDGGIKTQSQIKKEEEEQENRLKKIENKLKEIEPKLDAVIVRVENELRTKAEELETKINSKLKEFYIDNQVDKLRRRYKTSEMEEAVENSVFLERDYMSDILEKAYNIQFKKHYNTLMDIANSDELVNLLDFDKGAELVMSRPLLVEKIINSDENLKKVLMDDKKLEKAFNKYENAVNFLKNDKAVEKIWNSGALLTQAFKNENLSKASFKNSRINTILQYMTEEKAKRFFNYPFIKNVVLKNMWLQSLITQNCVGDTGLGVKKAIYDMGRKTYTSGRSDSGFTNDGGTSGYWKSINNFSITENRILFLTIGRYSSSSIPLYRIRHQKNSNDILIHRIAYTEQPYFNETHKDTILVFHNMEISSESDNYEAWEVREY